MKLSQTTEEIFAVFGYEDGIAVMAEAGFDAMDFALFNLMDKEEFSEENAVGTCERLRRRAEDSGIVFNQAHAPFPSCRFNADGTPDTEYCERTFAKIVRSIMCASLLGAKIIAVHPFETRDKRIQKEMNLKYYDALTPYCREYGIRIGVENMYGVGTTDRAKLIPNVCSRGCELAEYIDALPRDCFTACLDMGHSGLVGESADEAVRVLGRERLGALHVHDTDFRDDLHTIPYQGKTDWESFTQALADIEYDGDMTLEVVDGYFRPYRCDKKLMRAATMLLAETGRHIIGRITEKQTRKGL